MKKQLTSLLVLMSFVGTGQTLLKLKAIEYAPGSGYCIVTNSLGVQTYTPCATITSTTNLVAKTSSITINGVSKTFTSTPIFTTPLSDVLAVDPSTGGTPITSPDGLKYVTINDGGITLNGATTMGSGSGGEVGVYSSHAYMTADFQSATNIESNTSSNVFNHNIANTFNAPVNSFTGETIYNGPTYEFKGADIASSSTVNLGSATGNMCHITGTTTISSFGISQAGTSRTLVFDDALSITSNTASLILPGNSDILTAPGDVMNLRSEGSGNWRCTSYLKNDESPVSFATTITGYSVAPTYTCHYTMMTRKTYLFTLAVNLTTSNANTLTFTTPFNAPASLPIGAPPILCWIYDAGTPSVGYFTQSAGSNICSAFKISGSGFTASGLKSIRFQVILRTD